jgi:hypothetical protein
MSSMKCSVQRSPTAFQSLAGFSCLSQDVVVDVGHILHVGHLMAQVLQVTDENVEAGIGECVAQVGRIVRGDAADVDANVAVFRLERLLSGRSTHCRVASVPHRSVLRSAPGCPRTGRQNSLGQVLRPVATSTSSSHEYRAPWAKKRSIDEVSRLPGYPPDRRLAAQSSFPAGWPSARPAHNCDSKRAPEQRGI